MNKKDTQKLEMWKSRLTRAMAYLDNASMDRREALYMGSHEVRGAKKASNVRNIVYELVESEVDTNVPPPRVQALHEEDKPLARQLEQLLWAQAQRLHLHALNDRQERTVYVQGGDFLHVEWNPDAGFHCTMGDLEVNERHPRQVVPQPHVYDMEQMDYIFVLLSRTRKYLENRYGVKIQSQSESEPQIRGANAETSDDLVTQNIAYYRNNGVIGMFSWVDDQILADEPDYYGRKNEDGAVMIEEELLRDVTFPDGSVLPAVQSVSDSYVFNPDGSVQLDVTTGQPVLTAVVQHTMVPSYRPKSLPLVLRTNVSKPNSLLGVSDVDVIADQQDAVSKLGTKIQEKLLRGGSYVTMPEGVDVDTGNEELKIIWLNNAAQKSLIDVINVQPNISYDLQMLETNYSWAKSGLGISDSFQGKYDPSAISGNAKQIAANQSASRLASKREQKNQAYARLYRMMFEFLLAYCDDEYPVVAQDSDGEQVWSHFDRYSFLKRDSAGELYWNDEFLFGVDESATMSSNREQLWNMATVMFQSGGFGPINTLEAAYRMWTFLDATDYPGAAETKKSIRKQMDEEQRMQAQSGMDAPTGTIPEVMA